MPGECTRGGTVGKTAGSRGSAVSEDEGGGPTGVGGWTVMWTVGLMVPAAGSEVSGTVFEEENTAGCRRTWDCSTVEECVTAM